MLILSRRVGEKLIIGENVTVTILSVKGNQIRIGIEAPRDVRVNREEIHQRILKEVEASGTDNWAGVPAPKVKISSASVSKPARTLTLTGKR